MTSSVSGQPAAASEVTAVMPRLRADEYDQARSGYLSPGALAILRHRSGRGRHADPFYGTTTQPLDYVPRRDWETARRNTLPETVSARLRIEDHLAMRAAL